MPRTKTTDGTGAGVVTGRMTGTGITTIAMEREIEAGLGTGIGLIAVTGTRAGDTKATGMTDDATGTAKTILDD